MHEQYVTVNQASQSDNTCSDEKHTCIHHIIIITVIIIIIISSSSSSFFDYWRFGLVVTRWPRST